MFKRLRRPFAITLATFVISGTLGWTIAGQAPAPSIELISVATTGRPGGGQVFNDFLGNDRGPSHVSADNHFVAFVSAGTDLVAGDANGHQDVFVRDRQTGVTALVSRAPDGLPGNDDSGTPVISADARYVAFSSLATNLTPNDVNARSDVFLRDRQTGTTVLVSAGLTGAPGNQGGGNPAISADGRFVAFESQSTDLVAGPDANGTNVDVFVRDMLTGTTQRVSMRADGSPILGADSMDPSISADGRRVAFGVFENLPSGPPNLHHGVYVRDLNAGTTILVSALPDGTASPFKYNVDPVISANGRFVSFTSWDDLDPGHPDALLEQDGPYSDVFVRDLQSSTTTRVSLPFPGGPVEESGNGGTISADGRFVAYVTLDGSVRLRDLVAGTTVNITAPGGTAPDGPLGSPSISPDGRFVYFESTATNLVANDTDDRLDVFLYSATPLADLSLNFQASTAQPAPNSDVALTVVVANNGPSATTGIAVRAPLPAGLAYVSDTSGGAFSTTSGIWQIASLTAGSSARLEIVARFGAGPTVAMDAEVIASVVADPDSTPGNGDPTEDDQQTIVLAANRADLSLDLAANTSQPPVNANVTITMTIANAGPGVANGVAARMSLPAGLTFVSATPAGFSAAAGMWTVGTIGSGGSSTLVVVARVATDTPLDLVAEVSASNQPDPDSTPNNGKALEDDQKAIHLAPVVTGIVVNDASSSVNPNDGKCTLVEAIVAANTDAPSGNAVGECAGGNGADTIHLRALNAPKDVSGIRDEYRLNAIHNVVHGPSGLPPITSPITIDGGNANIVRAGGPPFRLFSVDPPGRLTLNDVTIAGGLLTATNAAAADAQGGGLFNLGVLEINNSEISANTASCHGGGIFSVGTLTIRGSMLRSNAAGCNGGGVANGRLDTIGIPIVAGGPMTLAGSVVSNNTATGGRGGGIANAGPLTITSSTIGDNQTVDGGGGAACGGGIYNAGPLTLNASLVTRNRGGGGLCAIGVGSIAATGATISANAGNVGGGVSLFFVPSATFVDSTIVANNGAQGGGVHSTGAVSLVLDHTLVQANSSLDAGGGLFISTGTLTLRNGTQLLGNTTTVAGGGIASRPGSTVNVGSGTDIRGNTAATSGGGIDSAGALSLVGATVAGNVADTGGGISTAGNMAIAGALFTGNRARSAAGIAVAGGAASLFNSTISGNAGTTGSGGLDVSGTATINASTIVDNAGNGGGIRNAANVTLRNTILAGNRRQDGTFSECTTSAGAAWTDAFNIIGHDAGCTLFTQVDVDPFNTSGTVDPSQLFTLVLAPLADNGGPTHTHAVRPGSLAIDAGDFTCGTSEDQRFNQRPMDGDGDGGARCDIGAFEAQMPLQAPTAAIVDLSPASARAGGGPLTLTVNGSGFAAGAVLFWNGAPRTTYVANPMRLAVVVPQSDLVPVTDIRSVSIAVVNPGAAASNVLPFTVVSATVAQVQSRVAAPDTTETVSLVPAAGQSGVSATFTNNGAASGPATVSVATYSANPAGGTIFAAGGVFDLQIVGADASDTVTARFYYPNSIAGILEAGLQLRFWTGTAWVPVVGAGNSPALQDLTDNLDGTVSGGRFTLTLDNTSVPPVTGLSGTIFALVADAGAPKTKAIQNPPPNANGWNKTAVTVVLSATDNSVTLAQIEYAIDGSGWRAYRSPIRIAAEGVHLLRFRSRDGQGRIEPPQTLKVRIDTTPPCITVRVRPGTLRPVAHQLVDVEARVDVDDELSGADAFTLVSAIGQDVGVRRTDTTGDIVGWALGTPDTSGQLRAEHEGRRRIYTLTYRGVDRAGNTAVATATVRVDER